MVPLGTTFVLGCASPLVRLLTLPAAFCCADHTITLLRVLPYELVVPMRKCSALQASNTLHLAPALPPAEPRRPGFRFVTAVMLLLVTAIGMLLLVSARRDDARAPIAHTP